MKPSSSGYSRRAFLARVGTTAVSAAALRGRAAAQALGTGLDGNPRGPGPVEVALVLNGERRTFAVEPRTTLLDLLRVQAGLTGAKEGCGRATCGACTVLLDGDPVYACMLLAIDVEGRDVVTVEGLSRAGLTPLQQAMVAEDALQCGYCSPGMVMSLAALLRRKPHPTEADVRKACSGNLCRCGSYPHIFRAALIAAEATASGGAART